VKNYFLLISSLFVDQDVSENSVLQAVVLLRVSVRIHYCCCCLSGISWTFKVSQKAKQSTANLVACSTMLVVIRVSSSKDAIPLSYFESKFIGRSVCHSPYYHSPINLSGFVRFPMWVRHVFCVSFLTLFEETERRPSSTLKMMLIVFTYWLTANKFRGTCSDFYEHSHFGVVLLRCFLSKFKQQML
jgi:hypothetical protein